MGHIELKRAKFKKGNFKPSWDSINGDLATLGRIKPSKAYYVIMYPYYRTRKTTATQKNLIKFMYKKTIKNWLA